MTMSRDIHASMPLKTGFRAVSPIPYARIDLSKYIVISIWFGCNNNCAICMLADMKRELPPLDFNGFRRIIGQVVREGKFKNLILSGAEVTTREDVDKFAQFARSLGYFDKIQIQTNGRRLRDRAYLERLINAGINEFFVSVHGLEEAHDEISGSAGAFKETMHGLENLENLDVNVISNTVLTKRNYHDVPHLLTLLSRKRISEIHLWNYFPMERNDRKDFIVSMQDVNKLFSELLQALAPAEKAVVLKSFPECLSVREPGFLDSFFPVTVLPDSFWREFSKCGFGSCVYRDSGRCKSESCWGLSTAYVQKYGDERNLLCARTR
jgi:MoaA/NifB/PqqE/SkfB family radical SAM enzyme